MPNTVGTVHAVNPSNPIYGENECAFDDDAFPLEIRALNRAFSSTLGHRAASDTRPAPRPFATATFEGAIVAAQGILGNNSNSA